MVIELKCVFLSSLQPLSETVLILRRTEQDMIINVYYSSHKFNDNLSSGTCDVPCGQTDRQDEGNSRFL